MQPINKVLLGTAQLGLHYGINNAIGKPSRDAALAILCKAKELGYTALDTAEAYGDAHEIIGQYNRNHQRFAVLTKLDKNLKFASSTEFEYHFTSTLSTLCVETLNTYYFHDFLTYTQFEHWDSLLKLQKQGRVEKLGVSIYLNQEALIVAKDERIDVVQMPYNLLDNNHQREMALTKLKGQNKEIHARSVFLQGLLFRSIPALPLKLRSLEPYLNTVASIAQRYNITIRNLALAYVFCNPLVDRIVIGAESITQLIENKNSLIELSTTPVDAFMSVNIEIQVADEGILNPSSWN